jgi:hypothetical protein
VYKELTELRAENKELRKLKANPKATGTPEGPPAARAKSAEPGAAEDAEVKAKKQRMDVLRGQIDHLEKGGEGLEEILSARRSELERLRSEVRAAHPLDVQLRNLDAKLGAVRKQREKLEAEAKTTAELILELKASLDKTAKAVAEKQAEESQLAIERAELVAKQAAASTPGGSNGSNSMDSGDGTFPEQLRGLGLEGLDPALRAGLRAFFASRAAAGTAPPAPAAAAASSAGPAADATAAAAAAAAEVLGRGAGVDAIMAEGSEGETEDAAKRRRLGRTAA